MVPLPIIRAPRRGQATAAAAAAAAATAISGQYLAAAARRAVSFLFFPMPLFLPGCLLYYFMLLLNHHHIHTLSKENGLLEKSPIRIFAWLARFLFGTNINMTDGQVIKNRAANVREKEGWEGASEGRGARIQ